MRNRLLACLVITAAVFTVSASERQSSLIYRRADRTTMMSVNGNIPNLNAMTKRYGSEYVWTRQNGREYVITDATVLAEVRAAFAKLDQVEAPMRVLEQRMKPHEREMERLQQKIDPLADQLDDERLSDATRESLERKLRAIEIEMEAVENRMEAVERDMERVTNIVEQHANAAEKNFEAIVARAIRTAKAQRIN